MLAYIETSSGRIYQTENPKAWAWPFLSGKVLGKAEGARRHAEQCADDLRAVLTPGDTVYSVLRHVSASGMLRRIDFYSFKTGSPVWLSSYMAGLLSYKFHKRGGLLVQGCGMDMGFHVVCGLSFKLYGAETVLRSEWI